MKKKILISCNMEIQHFYFVKSFIDKYNEDFNIKVIFQSHILHISLYKQIINYINKKGLIPLIKRVICGNKYSNIFNDEKKVYYNNFYPKINLEDFYDLIGKENIIISNNINSVEIVKNVKEFSPELFLLQGGKILKKDFLDSLKNTYILHLHLGLVPYYRGGNSQFWSIYNNKINENGFTIQSVDLGIDTGSIYIRKSIIDFNENDTQHSMFCKTHIEGIQSIVNLIDFYIKNNFIPKAIKNNKKGKNYSGEMVTSSANEYVYLNRKRVFENYSKTDKKSIYKDLSVL